MESPLGLKEEILVVIVENVELAVDVSNDADTAAAPANDVVIEDVIGVESSLGLEEDSLVVIVDNVELVIVVLFCHSTLQLNDC